MSPSEQKAFVTAYARHMGYHDAQFVAAFVAKTFNDNAPVTTDQIAYDTDCVSIIDALGMWHEAIKFQLQQQLSTTV